jgi:hypothetical protein
MFPLWFGLLRGCFDFLDVWVLSFCSLYSRFFWVLWCFFYWQGFIIKQGEESEKDVSFVYPSCLHGSSGDKQVELDIVLPKI